MSASLSTRGATTRRATRSRPIGVAAAAALGLACVLWASSSRADGVYGRFDGDIDWSVKVGSQWTHSTNPEGSGLSGSVGASAHYYSLFGVTLDYADGLDDQTGPGRSASLGMELRPLFLPRWLLNRQRGPAWLDLTIDSLAVGFGGYVSGGTQRIESSHGVWFSVGGGIPVTAVAGGPWLETRYTLRASDWSSGSEATRHQVLFYLSWHGFAELLSR